MIKRLVSLYDALDDMLAEADRRAHTARTGDVVTHTDECVVLCLFLISASDSVVKGESFV